MTQTAEIKIGDKVLVGRLFGQESPIGPAVVVRVERSARTRAGVAKHFVVQAGGLLFRVDSNNLRLA